jgi:hypothetical protein
LCGKGIGAGGDGEKKVKISRIREFAQRNNSMRSKPKQVAALARLSDPEAEDGRLLPAA